MLFDCDPSYIRTLMRENRVGKRDLLVKPKSIGPNEVTYVGIKSNRGLEFAKKLEEKLPKITLDFVDEEEEETEEEEQEDVDEGDELDELDESDELDEGDDEDDDEDDEDADDD